MQNEQMTREEFIRSEISKSRHKVCFKGRAPEEIMLNMGDGTSLRTIIYRPDTQEPVPAIITRTCYPELDDIHRVRGEEYSKRGLAFVYQYCRGTGGSEGVWEPNVNERADGKTTIDWICGQDWVKNAGYMGCSYLALTGWVIADILPAKVKTMYLTHYGVFRHTSAYKDGLFRHDVLTSWTMNNAGFKIDADYLKSCRYMPHIGADEKLWGRRLDWYRHWITASDRSDEYWEQGFWKMLRDMPEKVTVPIFMAEGWYDHHLGSAIETYCALSDDVRKKSAFLIGAWNHIFQPKLEGHSGVNFETSEDIRALDWFFDILVDEKEPQAQVKAYIIGDDSWHLRSSYQIKPLSEKRLHIADKNSLGVYCLTDTAAGRAGFASYTYDPNNPVISHGAESMLFTEKDQGSLLQPEPNYREDVISCISGVFEKGFTIFGSISVSLTVSSDAKDTAFAVKVMEIMSGGKTVNIRTGITTLGYRNGAEARLSYEPESKVSVRIDMWDIAWKVQPGSKIRIDITSSDFPQYSIHSNYAGCWSFQDKTRIAKQHVYFGSGADSYICFPILEDE